MAIEPVKIPQNVYVEDRIVGPITLRQIMIVIASSGISYAIWAVMKSATGTVTPVQTFFAWTPTMVGIAFAFVKINGISLLRILLLLVERMDKPARRIWMPRKGIYVNIITTKKAPRKKEHPTAAMQDKEQEQIEELSRVLDEGPQEVLTQEEEVPVSTKSKPVKRERIQADKRKRPVDDIQKAPSGLLRDITPPPSHA